MNINQELTLNLSADGIPPRLHMVQGDANTRTVVATLWDGAQPYTVPAASAVMIRFRKPDGTGGLYDTTESGAQVTVSGNTVTAPVATQMLAVAGVVQAQVDIYGTATGKAAEKLATFRFAVEVAPSVYPDAEIISSDYFNIIAADIGKAVEAAARAEAAQAAASAAQQGAESARDDAVNAKTAAESAKTAAVAAQKKSEAAQTKAETAQTAAEQSAAAAQTAKEGAETAQTGAQAAQAAAESAKAAAQTAQSGAETARTGAETARGAAEDSAEDAEAWAVGQRNGKDVPSTDPAYHNNAKYYKDQAQTTAGGEFVSYGAPQSLTDAQKQQARDNIGAPAPYEAGDNISITGRIITTKAFPCNPNLLDNWYFGNPVNQRGQTEWLSSASVIVPCVDRWNWWGQYTAGSTLKLLSDGLQLIGPTGAPGLYQKISQKIEKDRLPVGATVTLSALVKADVNASIILSIGGQNYMAVAVQANVWELITYTLNAPSVEQAYDISIQRNTAGATFTVKAVKLELGSQQTLAHKEGGVWVLNEIPKFGDQLAECQRYFVRIGSDSAYRIVGTGTAYGNSNCGILVPLPVEMRTIPAVSIVGQLTLRNKAGSEVVCSGVALDIIGAATAYLNCTASGLTLGASYDAYLAPGSYLSLSADL